MPARTWITLQSEVDLYTRIAHCVDIASVRQARSAGAMWDSAARAWYCNTTQFKSSAFRRWRDRSMWRRVTIHVADGPWELAAAKENRVLWDSSTTRWYVDVTSDKSLNSWHRTRLFEPDVHAVRIAFEEREGAKRAGARWDPEAKRWTFRCFGKPPGWVVRRSLSTNIAQPVGGVGNP